MLLHSFWHFLVLLHSFMYYLVLLHHYVYYLVLLHPFRHFLVLLHLFPVQLSAIALFLCTFYIQYKSAITCQGKPWVILHSIKYIQTTTHLYLIENIYVVDAHWKGLNETLPMSIHNIGICQEIKKLTLWVLLS